MFVIISSVIYVSKFGIDCIERNLEFSRSMEASVLGIRKDGPSSIVDGFLATRISGCACFGYSSPVTSFLYIHKDITKGARR